MIHCFTAGADAADQRLDVWLTSQLDGCSRSLVERLIRDGRCTCLPGLARPGRFLKGGETVEVEVPDIEPMEVEAEDIPLAILHEDEHLVVIDKAPGMVVHPAVGHHHGTLVNALLGRYGKVLPGGEAWRPGLAHRLDQDTSGIIVVARTAPALVFLQEAFKERRVQKRYLALVAGMPRSDLLENAKPLGRHPRDFRKRCVCKADAADAQEAYTSALVLHRDDGWSAIEARPRSGRTHQVRVHLADLGHPVLADRVYGRSDRWPLNASDDDAQALRRQALHAWTLDLPHPAGGELHLTAPIPADIARWLPAGGVAPRPR